jgi:hypothetical protein
VLPPFRPAPPSYSIAFDGALTFPCESFGAQLASQVQIAGARTYTIPIKGIADKQPLDATLEMFKRIARAIDDWDALDSFAAA